MGKLLVRFCEGLGNNQSMAQRLWHHRETTWQTENTNIGLQQRKSPVYSTNSQPALKLFGNQVLVRESGHDFSRMASQKSGHAF